MGTSTQWVDWFQVGGSLAPEEPTYVMRQADTDLYRCLREGDFCYVLNSRQMGKSSLRVRVMQRLRSEGWACAAIDLSGIAGARATDRQWYTAILQALTDELDLEDAINLQEWLWVRPKVAPLELLREFISDVVLLEVVGPVAIFIDEIDSVLRLGSFTDDLFAFIRSCYNRRADRLEYRRLTFALLGTATPSELIKDKRITPFNIGTAIALEGFQEAEAQVLVEGLKETAGDPRAALREVLAWTGGQPFLTQQVCQLVVEKIATLPAGAEPEEIGSLMREQVVAGWQGEERLKLHFQTLQEQILRNKFLAGNLLELYQTVLIVGEAGLKATGSRLEMELRITGLVVQREGRLRVYNRLYQEIFDAAWVEQELARNQRAEDSWVEQELARNQKAEDL